jgi:hypothetical protein
MHGHIYVLWDQPGNGGVMRIYALCETDRDVFDAIEESGISDSRLYLERWCVESTLEETGEW